MSIVPEADGRYDRDWLHEFAMVTAEVVFDRVNHFTSCIMSTHVGLEVLKHYGIPARPQPVTAYAMNRKAYVLREQNVPHEEWPDDAWSVGILGTGKVDPETAGWDGHLVLIVRNPDRMRTLIDLTAGQMARPHRQLNVPTVAFMDLNGLWTPKDALYAFADKDADNPTFLCYAPLMTAGDWRNAPDWTRDQSHLVEQVIAKLDKVAV